MSDKRQFIALLLGVFLTIISFYVGNISKYPCLLQILTPKYQNAMTVLDNMLADETFILKKDIKGFNEIAKAIEEEILEDVILTINNEPIPIEEFPENLLPQISSIRFDGYPVKVGRVPLSEPVFEIFFSSDIQPNPYKYGGWHLKKKIEDEYLNQYLAIATQVLLWSGVCLTLTSPLWKTKSIRARG